jgi:hypothetical protein
MGPERKDMTGWYDPRRLLSIGIRVAEATVFGEMFDRRELMASLDPFDHSYFNENCDFSHPRFFEPGGDFWFDFAADTGDGWIPVHAVARLLARPTLLVDGLCLPQGRVLIFGGDQVYPTASKEDYDTKLRAPFTAANKQENVTAPDTDFDKQRAEFKDRYLFALPGNHDWYDDLTAFTSIFCNKAPDRTGAVRSPGRSICGRATSQTRSYFALKLPHDWWLCAFDAQLKGYLDAPQIRFFEFVAQKLMAPGSNVILSVAGPAWAYSRGGEEAEGFSNFAFASLIATGAIGYKDYQPQRQHNLRLVLTGDAHHYAHFIERTATSTAVVHYLTCGLGGAFSHPTHWLEDTSPTVRWAPPPPLQPYLPNLDPAARATRTFEIARNEGGKQLLFPDRETSRRIAWKNLLFVWFNPWFGVFLGGVGLFAAWFLHFGALVKNADLVHLLSEGSLRTGATNLFWLLVDTPWPWVIIVAAFAAFRYFADFEDLPVTRWVIGLIHTAAHVLVFCIALLLLGRTFSNDFWLIVGMGVVTGLVSPSIMGVYLIVLLNGFGRHWNEAYSSLRIPDFKGFLRLKITAAGDLEVYPIVLERVPRIDSGELKPRLVEGPIVISRTGYGVPAHDGQASSGRSQVQDRGTVQSSVPANVGGSSR